MFGWLALSALLSWAGSSTGGGQANAPSTGGGDCCRAKVGRVFTLWKWLTQKKRLVVEFSDILNRDNDVISGIFEKKNVEVKFKSHQIISKSYCKIVSRKLLLKGM